MDGWDWYEWDWDGWDYDGWDWDGWDLQTPGGIAQCRALKVKSQKVQGVSETCVVETIAKLFITFK